MRLAGSELRRRPLVHIAHGSAQRAALLVHKHHALHLRAERDAGYLRGRHIRLFKHGLRRAAHGAPPFVRVLLRAAVRQDVKSIARVGACNQPDILFGSEQAGLDSGGSEVVSDEILHTSPFIAPSKKRVSLSAIFVSSKAASPQKIRIRS